MATDWPGHGAVNRHVHYPANCSCQKLFTEHNEPPWFFLCIGQQTATSAWWHWMAGTKYLYPTEHELHCEYKYQYLNPVDLEFRELLLTFVSQVTEPDQIEYILRATRVSGLTGLQYENALGTGVIPGPRIARGNIWTFPVAGWSLIGMDPLGIGPPPFDMSCAPEDCLAGWSWGELLPAEIT